MPFLDELDAEAEKIGAVNTIKVSEKFGKTYLTGFNTDTYGFEETLKPFLKVQHSSALILGTGGASKAVRFVLTKLGINFKMVSRTPKNGGLLYTDITKEVIVENKLIINTTPLGMFPNVDGFPNLPYQAVTDKHLFYDLIYNPVETQFLKRAKANGAVVVNGEDMLIKQAKRAWKIWNRG